MSAPVFIRDAATVIVVRTRGGARSLLMGKRGKAAAFMPNKFVFPGGAVDTGDAAAPLADPLPEPCRTRIAQSGGAAMAHAIAVAAIRELWEETGLIFGRSGAWPGDPPADWRDFAATGHVPSARHMQFVFRAVTPPGRPRRFDARFLLVDAANLAGDPDDFSAASDELSQLQWVPLADVRRLDLPFVTEIVVAEVEARLDDPTPPASVPFFNGRDEDVLFERLYGRPPVV